MEEINVEQLLQIARKAALEAGKAIMEVYLSGNFGATVKDDDSPLTLADKAAHQLISRRLQTSGLPILSEEGRHTPYEKRKDWLWYWLVDPLDGTKEFLKRNGEFTVNIALMKAGFPVGGVVYAPTLDKLYYGSEETAVILEENTVTTKLRPTADKVSIKMLLLKPEVTVIASRSHLTPETVGFTEQFNKVDFVSMGSSLKMMLLAENKADIYPRFAPTMEWDTAAAHAILNALGKGIYQADLKTELTYNKPDLLNPSFIAY